MFDKVIKKAISLNIPLEFSYQSKKSPHFFGVEIPAHPRVVQPVVLGTRLLSTGQSHTYFRGYLLYNYSYSRNKYFTGDLNRSRKPQYWRIYDTHRLQNVRFRPDFKNRFFPSKHKEYNPMDKWFNKILYSMDKNYSYAYRFTGTEESLNEPVYERSFEFLESLLHAWDIKDKMVTYAISENEEVGYIENSIIYVNSVWLEQTPLSEIRNKLNVLLTLKETSHD